VVKQSDVLILAGVALVGIFAFQFVKGKFEDFTGFFGKKFTEASEATKDTITGVELRAIERTASVAKGLDIFAQNFQGLLGNFFGGFDEQAALSRQREKAFLSATLPPSSDPRISEILSPGSTSELLGRTPTGAVIQDLQEAQQQREIFERNPSLLVFDATLRKIEADQQDELARIASSTQIVSDQIFNEALARSQEEFDSSKLFIQAKEEELTRTISSDIFAGGTFNFALANQLGFGNLT